MRELPPDTFVVGSKLYAKCADCGKFVQLNKFLIGSTHLCVPDERESYEKSISRKRS